MQCLQQTVAQMQRATEDVRPIGARSRILLSHFRFHRPRRSHFAKAKEGVDTRIRVQAKEFFLEKSMKRRHQKTLTRLSGVGGGKVGEVILLCLLIGEPAGGTRLVVETEAEVL